MMMLTRAAPSSVPNTETRPPDSKRAAQHGREKGGQQPVLSQVARHGGHGGTGAGCHHEAGQCRKNAGQHVTGDEHAPSANPGKFGGARIGAGRKHAAAQGW